ncbi:MAG TPA: hypothetical protein DCS70_09280 [Acinetobacter nosocomialis]|uniref:Uncharacterized protein n=1 Tax=Acinetobacter nosocomialis TaxID=106654 RepID=A0AB36M449_ACINO|nr:hypothetical protein [Acinetobacter nosocomialis]QCP62545.1 hypothetical protein FDQ49_00835 [Acinetobacter nosocomialis M2]OTL99430.1 hypothetical protein B9X58_05760 [Acinetobacter nosocomialis]OTT93495.1 hypothetical protein CAT69_11180 [Acinetobacter nosocomialis]OUJ95266.1 hypothetical protein BFG48_000430 [Acinetobacter nosocomialis]
MVYLNEHIQKAKILVRKLALISVLYHPTICSLSSKYVIFIFHNFLSKNIILGKFSYKLLF